MIRFKNNKVLIIIASFISLSVVLLFLNFQLVQYATRMAAGQLQLVWNAQPIEEVMKDPNTSDTLKQKLQLVLEIKQFAYDSLGMKKSDNYSTFYNQHGQALLWVVSASEKYELKEYEWDFPFLGKVPYKGFFDKQLAEIEIQKLTDDGYDSELNTTSGWSTLGWLKDPVLSQMLKRSEGGLANLILHELTHENIFEKDNVTYNENVASFIGEQGSIFFLESKYGKESEQVNQYKSRLADTDIFQRHILAGAQRLNKLYAGFNKTMDTKLKDSLKLSLIAEILNQADSLPYSAFHQKTKRDIRNINNVFFLDYITYDSQKEEHRRVLKEQFNGNLHNYFSWLVAQSKNH